MTLDKEALAGYQGNQNPHMYSSANWYAHELGIHFKVTGRTEPRNVRMSRGYSIRANDMLFKISGDKSPNFERAQ